MQSSTASCPGSQWGHSQQVTGNRIGWLETRQGKWRAVGVCGMGTDSGLAVEQTAARSPRVTVYAATAIASVRCRAPSVSAHPVDRQPQNNTFPAGGAPAAAPVFYLQGTADRGFRPTSSQQE